MWAPDAGPGEQKPLRLRSVLDCDPSPSSPGRRARAAADGHNPCADANGNGAQRHVLGVLEGTGIGPEVVNAALRALATLEEIFGFECEVRQGGRIGEAAFQAHGCWLTEAVAGFCESVFETGGAILSGPGGGRYVYDLRRRFDLFCKFVPVRPWPALADVTRLRPEFLRDVDLLLVRDNVGGVYQGQWRETHTPEGRCAEHSFGYTEAQVTRLLRVAAGAARERRGQLHVIVKDGGVPGITALWRELGAAVAAETGVAVAFMNADLAAYELIQQPQRFDVIAAPNLFGDILADITGALLGSRGVTFSGNFNAAGHAVYQTNHGCAHDLAGTDTANPAGQMLALAMLLRESFGLAAPAATLEAALEACWREGWRTADIAPLSNGNDAPSCSILGTRAMAQRVVAQLRQSADQLVAA